MERSLRYRCGVDRAPGKTCSQICIMFSFYIIFTIMLFLIIASHICVCVCVCVRACVRACEGKLTKKITRCVSIQTVMTILLKVRVARDRQTCIFLACAVT